MKIAFGVVPLLLISISLLPVPLLFRGSFSQDLTLAEKVALTILSAIIGFVACLLLESESGWIRFVSAIILIAWACDSYLSVDILEELGREDGHSMGNMILISKYISFYLYFAVSATVLICQAA